MRLLQRPKHLLVLGAEAVQGRIPRQLSQHLAAAGTRSKPGVWRRVRAAVPAAAGVAGNARPRGTLL